MRIIWDPEFKQFEAQFDAGSNWAPEQQAVKAAGFRTEGPPDWKWVSFRAGVLTKLKSALPASGLSITITPAALTQYQRLKTQEDTNAAVRAALKAHRKELGKVEDPSKGFEFVTGPEGFLIAAIEPGESPIWKPSPASVSPLRCSVCQTAVYSFEKTDPPTCLDCEFDPGL
jgi:hypothetical protein